MRHIVLLISFVCSALYCSGQIQLSRPKLPASGTQQNTSGKTVSDPDGFVNGHGYVDLGLPSGTKWATCNVGASSQEKPGGYYAWGETETKQDYSDATSKTVNKEMPDYSGNPSFDVAAALWGDRWCMPTVADTEELVKLCKWTWTKLNSTTGYRVTGPNGKSIFLPAAGWKEDNAIKFAGPHGQIWTSTPTEGNYGANSLNFYKGQGDNIENGYYLYRSIGANVRPVLDPIQ